MRLRIAIESSGAKTRIIIAGELLAEGIPELEQALGVNDNSLELDLSDLSFADSDGVAALRRLTDGGATVVAASLFVRRLLGLDQSGSEQGVTE